jgi:large subunit ribosomal protein L9
MKVILTEHIENLGNKGDVVNVKRGYARNYLIPREYALYGTPANMKRLGAIQDELKAAEEKKLAELKNLAGKNSFHKTDICPQSG